MRGTRGKIHPTDALFLVCAAIVVFAFGMMVAQKFHKEPHDITGVIANVNVHQQTDITIIPDGQLTPVAYTLCERQPQFWQGEHVRIQFQQRYDAFQCWFLDSYSRVGPDVRN